DVPYLRQPPHGHGEDLVRSLERAHHHPEERREQRERERDEQDAADNASDTSGRTRVAIRAGAVRQHDHSGGRHQALRFLLMRNWMTVVTMHSTKSTTAADDA